MTRVIPVFLSLLLVGLTACVSDAPEQQSDATPQPAPIAYGEDYDAYCDQLITDKRYGAVLITTSGERHTFSSVECMIGFEIERGLSQDDIEQRWVVDVVRNKQFLNVHEARFLHSRNQPSPGGLDLSAFEDDEDLSFNMRFLLHGDDLRWPEAVDLVRSNWFPTTSER